MGRPALRGTLTAALATAALAALGGCGGADTDERAAARPHRNATAEPAQQREAPEAVWMYRVLGDDPLPDEITVRRDGSVEVLRGGGHGGSEINHVVLPRREQRKVLRLARTAPLRMLAHNTIEPGGFGGSDNVMRYLIRRDHETVGVEQGHIPRPIRPLVHELDRIIEFDVGHVAHQSMRSGVDLG